MPERSIAMPVGVVVRRSPGATRWAKYAWKAVAVLPGAGPANWQELRREDSAAGEVVEYHAGTLEMTLYRTDTEAYRVALSNEPPTVFVIMDQNEEPDAGGAMKLIGVTASPFEAQDFADTGEEIVEPVPMPAGLIAWVREFVDRHHVDEAFIKRKRRNWSDRAPEDGIGDARVRQAADVYRTPASRKRTLN
ncbi:MAG: DUF3305 domain-containing protein [Pseudomonadota bacterium]